VQVRCTTRVLLAVVLGVSSPQVAGAAAALAEIGAGLDFHV
jgi:hypothetical protein